MKTVSLLLLGACLLAAASPEPVGPKRTALVSVQNGFDTRVQTVGGRDPMDVVSSTQGVYLQGFGAVFTAKVDLIVTPALSPFKQNMSAKDVASVRQRKLDHLPVLRQAMRDMLVSSAKSLDAVPLKEHLVVAVSLFFFKWEDREGLPSQIVMKGMREPLMKGATDSIQVDEY